MKAHIVACKRAGQIDGYQLRHDGGSAYFAVRKLGGVEKAREIAEAEAVRQGLTLKHYGRHSVEGIRWRWQPNRTTPVLFVVVSFTDSQGERHNTQYSTQKHGLAGALDLAIFARRSAGHKVNGRAQLLEALQVEFETGGKS